MSRLDWLIRAVACLIALLAIAGPVHELPAAETADLQETLENDLQARRTEEFEFIEKVVRHVNRGVLPETLVRRIHLWARGKSRHPYQYFERAMRIQARRFGVKL